MKTLSSRVRGHLQQYVNRYAVLAIGVLTPAAGLLGALGAQLGGVDTQAGRTVLGAAAAVTTAIAGLTWLRNSAIWQFLDRFGTTPQAALKTIITLDGNQVAHTANAAAKKAAADKAAPVGTSTYSAPTAPVTPPPDVDTSGQALTEGMPAVPSGSPIDEAESAPDPEVQ